MQEKKPEKSTFILICLGKSVNAICWLLIPLLLPLIREELHFSYTHAGLILTCFSTVILIFSMISGHLADLYEGRKILSFGFFLTVAPVLLLFLTRTYLQITVTIALIGIGLSVFNPVGMAYLSRSWKRGISFGFFESAGGMGVLVMTLIFTPLVSSLGWRLTSLILVLPSLFLGLAFLLSHRSLKYKDIKAQPQTSQINSSNSIGVESLILFYIGRGFQMFGYTAIISFIPLFSIDVRGLPIEKVSFFPIFFWIGAIAGVLACGTLCDHFSPLKIILTLVVISIPAIFIITMPVPLLVVVISLILMGFANVGSRPAQNVWLGKVTPERIRGKTYASMISLGSLGQIFSPLLFGFLADKWGIISSFRWAILPILVGTFCLGIVCRRVKPI